MLKAVGAWEDIMGVYSFRSFWRGCRFLYNLGRGRSQYKGWDSMIVIELKMELVYRIYFSPSTRRNSSTACEDQQLVLPSYQNLLQRKIARNNGMGSSSNFLSNPNLVRSIAVIEFANSLLSTWRTTGSHYMRAPTIGM